MKKLAAGYKRIVIKIGSSLFYSGKEPDISRSFEVISHISELVKNEDKEIVIVSSGAIALGMELLKLNSRPKELPVLQASAAIGQNALMDNYSRHFRRYGMSCAQILLTWDDFDNRQRYLNAKNTLLTLLKLGSVPVINENDTISTEEIKFGDNDRLSALVAALINADLLIILSDVDGLLDRDKNLIKLVTEINPQIKSLACPSNKKTCVGGMITKIEAAKIAVDSGIPCVIANGRAKNVIFDIIRDPLSGDRQWTVFLAKNSKTARKRWIAFGTKPKGKVTVDEGAKQALLNNNSLLSVGVINTEGVFDSGDIVSVIDKQDYEIARGKIGISSKQLEKVKGRRYDKEIIHRDNMVIL